jgi:CheY-like chemotaxis protein
MRYATASAPADRAVLVAAEHCEPGGYVLLVMDDPFLRKRLRGQVLDLGLPVQEAISVRRALARFSSGAPSLVVLDLWVDRGEGLAFLEALQAAEPESRVPVLLVGDDPRADVQIRALALGATGPIPLGESSEIAPWIEQALEARAQAERLLDGP